MKKVLLAACTIFFAFSACTQVSQCGPETTTASATEVAALQQWLDANGITATKDNRGFFYRIVHAGNATKPTRCSTVRIAYTGQLTDGTEFDKNLNASFALSNLIKGWQQAMPLIGEGGFIKMYLPPSLGYGSVDKGNIPANSILIFDVELMDVL